MKRFFILASAAIVALASCAKTEVVNNSGPQEIAFKQLAGPMTKVQAPMDHSIDMGVFAHTVEATPKEYFGNTRFAYQTDAWRATPSMYYPIQGELDFAFYSPYLTGWTWNGSTSMESPSYDNIKSTDVLYGKNIVRSAKTNDAVPVVLGHALAQVTVNVLTDDTSAGHITINSITLDNIYTAGKLAVSYASSAVSDVVWTKPTPATPSSVTWNTAVPLTTASQTFGTSFIIAEYDASKTGTEYEQGTLTVTYTMDIDGAGSGTATYDGTATFDLAPDANKAYWYIGNNYIYNIKATLTEIKFAPEVETLTDVQFTPNPLEL